ncbi:hypothetical protein WA026_001394 [Henosepilachna vigintioctopunctata]|uniref:FGFR1 oncogene partner (FOP) N-terminal dimerisation domain-containing protein n=1 Tax=Henosepilachna vigintioctopunctata TaxID=420089 RepID=A0AAW1UT93_9CUCU
MSECTEMDLLEAVKTSMQNDGSLSKFKAELRAAVMTILNKNHVRNNEPLKVPEETKLINELIREYMIWNGYLYSDKVFTAECGHNKELVERDILTTKLGVMDDMKTSKLPLLYYIVSAFQNDEKND